MKDKRQSSFFSLTASSCRASANSPPNTVPRQSSNWNPNSRQPVHSHKRENSLPAAIYSYLNQFRVLLQVNLTAFSIDVQPTVCCSTPAATSFSECSLKHHYTKRIQVFGKPRKVYSKLPSSQAAYQLSLLLQGKCSTVY